MCYSKIYPSTRISSNYAKMCGRKLHFFTRCTLKRINILFSCVLQKPAEFSQIKKLCRHTFKKLTSMRTKNTNLFF